MGKVIELYPVIRCEDCGRVIYRGKATDRVFKIIRALEAEGRFDPHCLDCSPIQPTRLLRRSR